MKFVCQKMKWEYNKADKTIRRVCHRDNPCTTSSCGRMIYVYPEKNLRAYPGVERGSAEWEETYKIRVNVEKSINHFKDSFCVANRKTQNEKTLHADLLLAGIAQLVTVIVADKIHQHQYIRSLNINNLPCIRFIVCGEFAFPIITPIVYLFSIRMLPFHKSLFSFYFTIFFCHHSIYFSCFYQII